jgi:hypothetical protein
MTRTKPFHLLFILITSLTLLVSCQKEIDGTIAGGGTNPNPADQKPKVGTTWTYQYLFYNSAGGMTNSKIIYHKAKSEETIGGEKWLKIVDVETDTTVYYLNTKTDGLYQYTNNNAYLLCKYPAAINDTYNTFNGGAVEDFTVRGVNDTTATGIGNIALSKYEGVKIGIVIDLIWYNKNAWVVWKYQYRYLAPPLYAYYISSKMHLESIVY